MSGACTTDGSLPVASASTPPPIAEPQPAKAEIANGEVVDAGVEPRQVPHTRYSSNSYSAPVQAAARKRNVSPPEKRFCLVIPAERYRIRARAFGSGAAADCRSPAIRALSGRVAQSEPQCTAAFWRWKSMGRALTSTDPWEIAACWSSNSVAATSRSAALRGNTRTMFSGISIVIPSTSPMT